MRGRRMERGRRRAIAGLRVLSEGTCVCSGLVPVQWYYRGLVVFLDTLTLRESCRPAEGKTAEDNDLELGPESLKVPGMGLKVGPYVRGCETERSCSERDGTGGSRSDCRCFGSTSACVPRVARWVGLLTSGMGRRRPSLSRQGRDREVRPVPNYCAVFKKVDRTELSQALLDQGRSCCGFVGRFGVPAWGSTHSRREDIAWSGGNAVPCMVFVFFVEWYHRGLVVFLDTLALRESCCPAEGKMAGDSDLVTIGPYVCDCETESLGDQLLRWCACEACGLGFTVIEQTSSMVLDHSRRRRSEAKDKRTSPEVLSDPRVVLSLLELVVELLVAPLAVLVLPAESLVAAPLLPSLRTAHLLSASTGTTKEPGT
ncbi:hypothetical protein Taro_004030 [Colocasia esculenta]|uniref:Uncharacterized protein n=1 Tax=Colocasia esculenta TaxID=4460 RepID=A0A843TH56_COLES|nr:hypothetical protein [Colocasia esculenta]